MAGELPVSAASEDIAPISAINVTPFVDVVLVLLVIFMVTAPALMKDSLGLRLPKATSADQKSASSLGIAVTRQGQILINGQMAAEETVSSQVKEALRANPSAHALISADADARHADVVRAIDLVRSAGMEHFAIQIEKP
jgi:biopolymer transport protein ExbD